MVLNMGKPVARSQKTVTLTPAGKAAFEAWCAANNYDPNGVLIAGWRLLLDKTHDERKEVFARADQWKRDGFTMNGDAAADRRRSKTG